MKRTIITLLKGAAEKTPEIEYLNEKIETGWTGTTFEQVDILSDYFALSLIEMGLKKKEKIAILAEGRTKWVIGEYGILKSGLISVPLSVKLTPEEIIFRLNHSEAKAILISHNHIAKLIPVLNQIKCKKFKIIYLDTDYGFLKNFEEKYPTFNFDKSVLFFDKLTEQGKNKFDEIRNKLDKCIESIEEDDVATISYTSGTTGNPKGIMLTHLNYYSNVKGAVKLFDVPPASKLFIILPIDHSFAHTAGIYVGLIIPLRIYFLDTRGGSMAALKNIPINIKEVKPNMMLTVPALSGNFMKNIISEIHKKGAFVKWLFDNGLKAGIKMNGNGFEKNKVSFYEKNIYKLADKLLFSKIRNNFGGQIRFCVGGGALLDLKQQEFFYTIGMPIYQGYGLTEASPVISANSVAKHKLGTSGFVLDNVECKIIDDGKELETGQKGEIFIKAESVMKGYFKNPDASKKVLRDGGLYTGDLGYFDDDGFLVVTGREKALLISEDGEKYSPEEIEEAISSISNFISQVMLYNDHSKYTTAIITLDDSFVKNYVHKNQIKSPEELLKIIDLSIKNILIDPAYSGKFQKKWFPAVFRIAPENFNEQNKMVNSTMKMVRHKIVENYKNLIEEMYSPNGKIDNSHNLAVLQRFFN
jgi:long-chain acyl-CoA synthetase